MPVETQSLFASVIQEHLELRRRNAALEHDMPLKRYMPDDPFENHPLFKTEEQARLEETLDGVESPFADDEPEVVAHAFHAAWPGEKTATDADPGGDSGLWGRSRDFDWGD